MNKLELKYQEAKNNSSDINLHLEKLKEISDNCDVVVELGVRNCVSIYAMVNSSAKKVYGIDIAKSPQVDELELIAKESGKDFEFILGDDLKIEIPECDFIFIDTYHSKLQLEKELALHAHKAKKYLGFHDTQTFWLYAESSYQSAADNQVDGPEGLKYAIEPFMVTHPEWKQIYRTDLNNGLLILERT